VRQVGSSCPPGVKRLFTSAFTAQTLGFQSHNYRRVGGFAAVASGEDACLVDRFRAASSDLGCVVLEPTKAAGSAYLSRRAREEDPANPRGG
jgi:hypothetical protein